MTNDNFEVGDLVEVDISETEYEHNDAFKLLWDGWMGVVNDVGRHYLGLRQLCFCPHRGAPHYKGIVQFNRENLRIVCKRSEIVLDGLFEPVIDSHNAPKED